MFTLIQRSGAALNLNVHLHMLFLDGAYALRGRGGAPAWASCRLHP